MKKFTSYISLLKKVAVFLLGFLFFAVFLMGVNIVFFQEEDNYMLGGIIICALALYVGCYLLVTEDQMYLLNFGLIGFGLAALINYVNPGGFEGIARNAWYKNNEPFIPYQSIKPVQIKANVEKCQLYKYGTFYSGTDTITRYREGEDDYEMINTEYEGKPIKLLWLDDCSYHKILEKGLVLSYIRMGDFEGQHYTIHSLYLDQSSEPKTRIVQPVATTP